MHIILTTCLLCGLIGCCCGGDHPCPADYELEIDMTSRPYHDDRLVADLTRSRPTHCKWRIKVPQLPQAGKPLVLEGGVDGPNKQEASPLQYELHDPTSECRTARMNVTPGFFCVLPLTDSRTYLSVSFDRRPDEKPDAKPVILRAVAPYPGLCGRDMLGLHGICYALSPVSESALESMKNTMGVAQLASFTSVRDVIELIKANDARIKIHPFKRPLNLTQRVRIGVFRRRADDTVVSVGRNETGCGLVLTENATDKSHSSNNGDGDCGFLEFGEPGQVEIRFGDCNESMPALMSFPESTQSRVARCTDCSFRHDRHVTELWTQLMQDRSDRNVRLRAPAKKSIPIVLVVAPLAIAFAVLVIAAIVVGVVIVRRQSQAPVRSKFNMEDKSGRLLVVSSVSSSRVKQSAGDELLTISS